MSDDFFPELRNMLDNEWIVIADACALFAGWCPLGEFDGGSTVGPNTVRQYKRIRNGEIEVPSEKDFAEMRMFQDKWIESNFDIPLREPHVLHDVGVSHECSVIDAFKVGLGWNDERIDNLYDAAVQASIIPRAFGFIRRDHHHVTVGVTGVTATGEVGEIPKPKFQFYLKEIKQKKPTAKLLYRFLKEERDEGNPKPSAHDFIMWVHVTKPTEPLITILAAGGKGIKYYDDPDDVLFYKHSTMTTAIADLTTEK